MAIPALLAGCPDLAVDETEELRWRVGFPGRALLGLPITFTPTGS